MTNNDVKMDNAYIFDTALSERLELCVERISEIPSEEGFSYDKDNIIKGFFDKQAELLLAAVDVLEIGVDNLDTDALKKLNDEFYAELQESAYANSWLNPAYATKQISVLQEYSKEIVDNETNSKANNDEFTIAQILSFLATELRNVIIYAYKGRAEELVVHLELYLEFYLIFASSKVLPGISSPKASIYYHMFDYATLFVGGRLKETLGIDDDFGRKIVEESDLSNTDYLYKYAEYIGEDELKIAEFFAKQSEETIDAYVKPYVEGYIEGFKVFGLDYHNKKYVQMRYNIGMERLVRSAIKQFKAYDMKPVIMGPQVGRINKRLTSRIGYINVHPCKQFEYDHRMDEALFFDKNFAARKLEVIENTLKEYKAVARLYGGPACVESFGEEPFKPAICEEAIKLSDEQNKLYQDYTTKNSQISNKYIPRDEMSFTIIAYPIPAIGDKFEEIMEETFKVNTLDVATYRAAQQSLIDAMDKGEYVVVKGAGNNSTDIKVNLWKLNNPDKETIFENCLADVNIPLGEVFTSPVLDGTEGVLNVSEVFLDDLKYVDLKLTFKDGCVTDYICKNFDDEAESKAFIKENLLKGRDTLPIGEFAIGTNTTAYVMARKYDILHKLPILIVEKTGPHFAVGDTCYSYSEELKAYNPDGKEIVAKENKFSALRASEDKEEQKKAYFNCHTDITIPYDEIGRIFVLCKDGSEIDLIIDGRFVLPGTEELNKVFDN